MADRDKIIEILLNLNFKRYKISNIQFYNKNYSINIFFNDNKLTIYYDKNHNRTFKDLDIDINEFFKILNDIIPNEIRKYKISKLLVNNE